MLPSLSRRRGEGITLSLDWRELNSKGILKSIRIASTQEKLLVHIRLIMQALLSFSNKSLKMKSTGSVFLHIHFNPNKLFHSNLKLFLISWRLENSTASHNCICALLWKYRVRFPCDYQANYDFYHFLYALAGRICLFFLSTMKSAACWKQWGHNIQEWNSYNFSITLKQPNTIVLSYPSM